MMNQTHVREGETTFVNQTDARVRPFRLTVLVTLVLLVLQYVLGVLANLEVQLPSGNDWSWVFGHSLIIQLHIYIGTLLIVVALLALILGIVARHPVGIVAAVAGLALLIFAWLSGDQFLVTQDDGLSLLMALGFMGAFVAYLLGYYLSVSLRERKEARILA